MMIMRCQPYLLVYFANYVFLNIDLYGNKTKQNQQKHPHAPGVNFWVLFRM